MKKKRFLSFIMAALLFFVGIIPIDSIKATEVTESTVPLGRQWITGEVLGEAVVVNPNMRSTVGSNTTITPGTVHNYGSWSTNEFSVATETGTHLGFCAEPNSTTPSGTFKVAKINNDTIEALVLIYIIPELYNAFADNLYNTDIYAATHAAIGYLYSGSTKGLSASYIQGIKNVIASVQNIIATNPTMQNYLANYELYVAYNDKQDIVWVEKSDVKSNLTITKRSYTDKSLVDGYKYLTGVTFELYAWTGSNFSKKVSTSIDNGNGTYTFKNISKSSSADGTFLVKEVKSKEGYSSDYYKFSTKDVRDYNVYGGRQFELHSDGSWTCFSLTADPTNTNPQGWGFEFLNYPEDKTVTITKVDSTDESKILSGAKFSLYAYQNRSNTWGWHKIGDFAENTVTDAAGSTIGNGTYSVTFPFDKATLTDSKYTYSIVEEVAPEGYKLDENMTIAESGYKFSFSATAGGTTEFTIGNLPSAEVVIHKSSANPDLTDNNNCYSLEGAEYTLYRDEACKEPAITLITDASGNTGSGYVVPGTYWIKETKAPYGYALDESVQKIVLADNSFNEFSFKDEPLIKTFDPYAILLGKIDAETNMNKPQGSASLQSAEYTIKFFEGDYAEGVNPEDLGISPDRTWVLKTDEDGYTRLAPEYLVSGDEFYYLGNSKNPNLPLGTLVIQESKPPVGYQISDEIIIRRVIDGGGGIAQYNEPDVYEVPLKITITKKAFDSGNLISGTEITHVKPDGTKEVLQTDENGVVAFYGLEQGNHLVYETKASEWYELNPNNKIEFNISERNAFSFINTASLDSSIEYQIGADRNGEVVFYNNLIPQLPFTLSIHKVNQDGTLLDGAEFTLYSDKELTDVVEVRTTENGTLSFSGLELDRKYYLKETKAPEGYRLPKNNSAYEIYADPIRYDGEFNFYVNGAAYTTEHTDTNSDIYLSGEKNNRIVNVKVVNQAGIQLPDTGSNFMIPLVVTGVLLMVVSMLLNKKFQIFKRWFYMKKRKMSKILSMLLTVIMVFSLSVTAFADSTEVSTPLGVASFGEGDASIVITQNDSTQSLLGKKFNVYKLFNAENSVDLESINYTFNEDYKEALQNIVGAKLSKTPADVTEYEVLDYIQTLNNNKVVGAQATQVEEGRYSDFRFFIEDLRNEMVRLGNAADVVTVTEVAADGSVTIGGLAYGYYIIDEVTDNQGDYSASSLCMVTTANPEASIKIKSDYPTVTKKIQEDDNNVGWNDIADFEIGQTVPYKFTSNVPNMNGYATYFYAWHDVMDEALTFNKDSVKIVISSDTKTYTMPTSEYTVEENVGTDTFKVSIADLKAIVDREFDNTDSLNHNVYGQTITLTYNATLNEKAIEDTGRPGFENDVRLEFSNDPDSTGTDKTGFTPWDTVVCFTYKLNVLKTNENDKVLADSKFRLYADEDCTEEVYVKATEGGYIVINRDSVTGNEAPSDAVEMKSDADGKFTIYGLDGGVYYLKETDAPDGYRLIEDPIKITITPSFTSARDSYVKGNGVNDTVLKDLEYEVYIKKFLDGLFDENTSTLEKDVDDGAGNLVVVNHAGKKLPITGSSATIIILAVGVTSMLGAVIYNRKNKKAEKTS